MNGFFAKYILIERFWALKIKANICIINQFVFLNIGVLKITFKINKI